MVDDIREESVAQVARRHGTATNLLVFLMITRCWVGVLASRAIHDHVLTGWGLKPVHAELFL